MVQLLALFEHDLKLNELKDADYFLSLAELALEEISKEDLAETSLGSFSLEPRNELIRTIWTLRQRLLDLLGIDQADWDFQNPLDQSKAIPVRFPFSVWLEDVRSPFNVGSIVRTAEAYGFQSVFLSPHSPSIENARVQRSSMESWKNIEISVRTLSELKNTWKGAVFALELGGTPVDEFDFTAETSEPSLVLVGSEELGLSRQALEWADEKNGRVALPLYGVKSSLNVSVAFGILASWWTAQKKAKAGKPTLAPLT